MRHTGAVRIALVHYTALPSIAGVELVMAEHGYAFGEAGHAVTFVTGSLPPTGRSGSEPVPPFFQIMPEEFPAPPHPGPPPAQVTLADLSASSPLAQAARTALAGEDAPGFEAAVQRLITLLRPHFAEQDVVMLHNVATMHFHPALTAAVWRLADELTRVRFVCWVHDLAAANPDYAPALPLDREPWSLLTRAHPRFTYVAVSELRQRQFAELTGQPLSRCRTIPNGVDPARTLDLSPQTALIVRSLGLLDRELVLLQPARLLRRKNVELTLRVTAALKAAGVGVATLVTAPPEIHSGAGEAYTRELRALHRALGLENDVCFLHDHTELGPRGMREVYQLADALFFPSWQEGFGIPLLEAALHRLPIFSSDIEPLRGLLPRGVTTFAPDAAPENVAKLICETLAADAAHSARRHTLLHFSWPAISRNFLSPLLAELNTP